jgi:hypothetical protein
MAESWQKAPSQWDDMGTFYPAFGARQLSAAERYTTSSSTSASSGLCVTCRCIVCRPTARAASLRMVLRIYAPVSGNHTARYFVKRKHKNLLR